MVPLNFRDLWMAERFEPRCWRFFAARFQFLRANQPAGAVYDYYLIWGG